jgi:hypothetical protein
MNQSHRQGRRHQFGTKVMCKSPTDDSSAIEIHDHGQVQPPFLSRDIADITDPHLISTSGFRQLYKPIGSDWLLVGAIGRLGPVTPLGSATEPELSPDSIDALATVLMTLGFEFGVQPGVP